MGLFKKKKKTPEELFEEGLACYEAKDYERALALLEEAAGQGHVKAQVKCANMYKAGEGAGYNSRKISYWYDKAAEQGDPQIQYECGWWHESVQSLEEAIVWFEKAARQGHIKAQEWCMDLYDDYVGPMGGKYADLEKSLYWSEKAAEQGSLYAKYRHAFTLSHADPEVKAANREKAVAYLKTVINEADDDMMVEGAEELLSEEYEEETI